MAKSFKKSQHILTSILSGFVVMFLKHAILCSALMNTCLMCAQLTGSSGDELSFSYRQNTVTSANIQKHIAYFKLKENINMAARGRPCDTFSSLIMTFLTKSDIFSLWSRSISKIYVSMLCFSVGSRVLCATVVLRGEPELPTVSGSQLRPCCCELQWAWLKPSLGWFRGK